MAPCSPKKAEAGKPVKIAGLEDVHTMSSLDPERPSNVKVTVADLDPESKPQTIAGDSYDDATAGRLLTALADSRATAASSFLYTAFKAGDINNGGAKGKPRNEPWLDWCKRREKAAAEPQQRPDIHDAQLRKFAQPYEVGAVLEGGKRRQVHAEAVTWLPIDFDKDVDLGDGVALADLLHRVGVPYLVTESGSSNDQRRKIHAYIQIVPLPLTTVEGDKLRPENRGIWASGIWRPVYHLIVDTLRRLARIGAPYDPSVADIVRAMYIARIPDDGAPRWQRHGDGLPLDIKQAARRLQELGVEVPAVAYRKTERKTKKSPRPGRVDVDADIEADAKTARQGGALCLHSHQLHADDVLSWARQKGTPADVLPDRKKDSEGHFIPSPIPLGVQVFRVSKHHGLLGGKIGPRMYELLCPRADEHGPSCQQRNGVCDSSTVLFTPDDVDDVEAYVDPADGADPTALASPEVVAAASAQRQVAELRVVAERLLVNDKGTPLNIPKNIVTILTADPRWRGVLAFNELASATEKLKSPPWDDVLREVGDQTGPWTDADDRRLMSWLAEHYGIFCGGGSIVADVELAARTKTYHPVRAYFDSLKWDGTPRVHGFFAAYFGADDDEYTHLVSRVFLLSAVARAYDPGTKVDTTPVCEGKQGLKKSSTIAALLPDRRWFADTQIDLNTKDRYIQLQGVFLYEVAELAGLSSRDASEMKNYLSSRYDNFVAKYARRAAQVPRQCVFIGSVNVEAGRGYLKDTTGNRRYLPVYCRRADKDAVVRDRDQLWAESVARYKQGERYWPETVEEKQMCEDAAVLRVATGDSWVETVAERYADTVDADVIVALTEQWALWGAGKDKKSDAVDVAKLRTPITEGRILEFWLGIPKGQQRGDQRLARVLAELRLRPARVAQRVGDVVVKQVGHENEIARRRFLGGVHLAMAKAGHSGTLRETVLAAATQRDCFDGIVTDEQIQGYDDDQKQSHLVYLNALWKLREWAGSVNWPTKSTSGAVDGAFSTIRAHQPSLADALVAASKAA